MRKRSINIEKAELERMYVQQRQTLEQICGHFGTTEATVYNRLREFGLERALSTLPIEEVKAMYATGKTIVEVAKEFGYSRGGIRKALDKAGVLRPREYKNERPVRSAVKVKPTSAELEEMFIGQKMSDVEIGNLCGVCNITVASWRKKHGIKRDNPVNYVPLPADELRAMYIDQKMKMEDIAKHFDCGESTVRAHIIRNGFGLDSKEIADRRLDRNKERYAGEYTGKGYKMLKISDHPSSNSEGYIGEHRYVAEQAMGKYLEDGEQVHHINVDKLDNRVQNLAVLNKDEHSRVHKYMERVGAYMCRLTDKKPEPMKFDREVFWAGQWVTGVDLAACRDQFREFQESKPNVGHMAFVN